MPIFSIRTGATNVYQKKPLNPVVSCFECGHVWTDEEKEDTSCVRKHMIEEHGYKQVGQQVFKSTPCVACPKPGLYRIGSLAYCKDHVHLGQSRLNWRTGVLDKASGVWDREIKKNERAEISQGTLKKVKRH